MTLWDLIKYTFLVGILVLATTGISFFDRETRTAQKESDSAQKVQASFDSSRSGGARIEENPASFSPLENTFITPDSSPDIWPIRDWNIASPEIEAQADFIFDASRNKVLYEKNIYEQLPIASITKLMTALTVLEYTDPQEIVSISRTAVATESAAGNLIVGEEITVENLLKALLIESSNDAAIALEEHITNKKASLVFVEEMNRNALELGLAHTSFKTSTGLDIGGEASNFSTSFAVGKLGETVWANELLRSIISTSFETVFSVDGYAHQLTNSNRLLGTLPEILGSKTGYTEHAQESIVSVVASPAGTGEHLVIVVLGTSNRERATKSLIDWLKKAYRW